VANIILETDFFFWGGWRFTFAHVEGIVFLKKTVPLGLLFEGHHPIAKKNMQSQTKSGKSSKQDDHTKKITKTLDLMQKRDAANQTSSPWYSCGPDFFCVCRWLVESPPGQLKGIFWDEYCSGAWYGNPTYPLWIIQHIHYALVNHWFSNLIILIQYYYWWKTSCTSW